MEELPNSPGALAMRTPTRTHKSIREYEWEIEQVYAGIVQDTARDGPA